MKKLSMKYVNKITLNDICENILITANREI